MIHRMTRICLLKCLNDSHPPIELLHLEKSLLGRSKLTGITNPNCSRQQLSLEADCSKCIVKLQPLGINLSGLNGFALKKDTEYIVTHGSHIEILLNQHVHKIIFDPPPSDTPTKSELQELQQIEASNAVDAPQKRKANDVDDDHDRKRKKNKTEDRIEILVSKTDPDNRTTNEENGAVENSWEDIDNGLLHIFTSMGHCSRSKVAGYDMDGTLIKTKSGKVFPQNVDDWQIAFPEVPSVLKKHHASGYKIVIFTNQAGIGKGKIKVKDFKRKLESIVSRIGVPVQAFVSTGKGVYRKPAIGMWDALTQMKNDDIKVDINESFYCGDAAGRLAGWAPGKKKDHSSADRLWAENLKLKFITPESHFQNIPEVRKWSKPEFDPKMMISTTSPPLERNEKEVVVLVGFPGSGKSIIAQRMERNSKYRYKIVCRDTLGTWQKCASNAATYLDSGKSVIVDSTNPDVESRARWIEVAKKKSVPCRCFKMATTLSHSKHNNRFRELTDTTHAVVTDMVYHTYKNKYKDPSLSEGFSEIVDVQFIPEFENDDYKKLYYMHLIDK